MNIATDNATPAPGSDEAAKLGCTCPVLDNGHGRGYKGMPGIYVYNAACPVHAAQIAEPEPEAKPNQ